MRWSQVWQGRTRREQGTSRQAGVGLPWHLGAPVAALASTMVGLLLVTGLVAVAWVEVPDVSFWSALGLSTRVWLLGHGAALVVGSITITIVPLGLTLLLVVIGSIASGLAARLARGQWGDCDDQSSVQALVLRIAGLFTAAYVACVMVPSFLVNEASQSGHAFVGAVLVGAVSGLLGAGRSLGWRPIELLPDWARSIPKAIGLSLATMLATGLVVGITALVMNSSRVMALHRSLQPTAGGAVALVVAQLLWLPNFVLWCASWALGAGISLGLGTVVSPAQNLTGLLPAVPVFGAVPPNGVGPKVALAWLLSGVLAGAVAAWVVVRSRRAARCDETALVGGLSGVLAGASLWLLAKLSNGDLGTARLVGLGARLVHLGVMAPTVMGLSGLLVGLVLGVVRRPGDGSPGALDGSGEGGLDHLGEVELSADDEATQAMDDLDQVVHRDSPTSPA